MILEIVVAIDIVVGVHFSDKIGISGQNVSQLKQLTVKAR